MNKKTHVNLLQTGCFFFLHSIFVVFHDYGALVPKKVEGGLDI